MSRKPASDRIARPLPDLEGPDITVVIPVAPDSPAGAIGRSLESLRDQSLPADLHEIILLGTPDSTAAETTALAALGRSDCRLRRFVGFGNGDGAAARTMRTLWHECRAPIVALLGAGVEAHPSWLSELFAAFGAFDRPPAAVAGPVEGVWPGPRPPWLPDAMLSWLPVVDLGPDPRHLDGPDGISIGNLAFRRDLLLQAAGEPDTGDTSADAGAVLMGIARDLARGSALLYAPRVRTRRPVEPEKLNQTWLLQEADRRGREAGRLDRARGGSDRMPLIPPLLLKSRLLAALGHPASPRTMQARCDLALIHAFRAEMKAGRPDRRDTQRK